MCYTIIEDDKAVKSLVSRAAAGDNDAFESLMHIYDGLLRSNCKKKHITGLELDDLMQIGWMTMLSAVSKYNESVNVKFDTFLVSCVNNALTDEFRKSENENNVALNNSIRFVDSLIDELDDESYEKAPETMPISSVGDYSSDLENDTIKTVISEDLQSEIEASLNETEYKIIELMFEHELTYKEIADELGLSVKRVDNTWYKIKKRLRALLMEKKDELF